MSPAVRNLKADHARVDREVGARVRARREALALSQTWLGAQVGVSFQQVQKYETGKNRISTSVLLGLTAALQTTPAQLLDGLGADGAQDGAAGWAATAQGQRAFKALHPLPAQAFDAVLATARAVGAAIRQDGRPA